jgi:DNA-binding NtrC family response regulator
MLPTMSEEAAVVREAVSMNILIVDDEPTIREACAEVAQQNGMKAVAVATAGEALEVLEHTAIDILLTDLMLPRTSGLELLKRVRDTHPMVPVIVLTQYGTIDSAVTATRLGAVDYVTKPFRIEELRTRLERAARAVELQQENQLSKLRRSHVNSRIACSCRSRDFLFPRFLAFERRYEETASPFQWTFTRKDLTTLLAKIENKRLASAA